MSDPLTLECEAASGGTPKRRQVLDAAELLFLDQGYGSVSMEAVARTAGVSKATLYAYFESKDRLFATIVGERGIAQSMDDGGFPLDVPDLRAALTGIGERILRLMLRERTLRIYRIAVAESSRFPELGRAFYENGALRTCGQFTAWLERQHAAGLVDVADPLVAAQQFLALLRCGVFMRAALAVPPLPQEEEVVNTVAAAVETWLRAFGRPLS